jgi:hypothetical protein
MVTFGGGLRMQKRSVDLYRASVLFLIAILYAEWIPFFLQIVMNFIIIDEVTDLEFVFIASFLLTPVISLLLSGIAQKFRQLILKSSRIVTPILMVITAVIYWLFFAEYYNYIMWDEFTIPGVSDMSSLIGFFGSFTPYTQAFLLYGNAITFMLLVPFGFMVVTKGTSCITFDSEFNLSAIGVGLYMLLRFGSIVGTPLRISMAIVCILFLITVSKIVKQKTFGNIGGNPEEKIERNPEENIERNPEDCKELSTAYMPKFIGFGILTIFGFWIGVPGLLYNGMMIATWVWGFFLLGALLHTFKSPYRYKTENILRENKKGSRTYLLLGLVAILLIFSGSSVWVLSLQPWLISLGLFLFIMFIPGNPALFSDKSGNRYLTHPVRLFLLGFFTFLSFAISFVAVLFQPLSSWAVMLFQLIFIIITQVGIRRNLRKNQIKIAESC